jgi:hypothetical protein
MRKKYNRAKAVKGSEFVRYRAALAEVDLRVSEAD